MKPHTFQIQYIETPEGYTLIGSRAGTEGAWETRAAAIPPAVASSFDLTVTRSDGESFHAYSAVFAGEPAEVSRSNEYRFTVTGTPDLVLTASGEMRPQDLPMDPVPDDLMAAIKAASSNRWRWDRIHLCITGKDADLEPHGHQGAEILGVREGKLICVAHIGKTFAGSDVSLNLLPDQDEERATDLYMEQATEIVCGCDVAGEWDGDSWFMSDSIPFEVSIKPTTEETVSAVTTELEKTLAPLEKELVLADSVLRQSAGWIDENGEHCPEGSPSKGSVAYMLQSSEV